MYNKVGILFDMDLNPLFLQVMHSQRMNDTPLRPWIIAEKGGKIMSAHCHCMAGLGEACTLIAATLFWVDAIVHIRETKIVTQEKAYWMLPTGVKKIAYQILTLHQQKVKRYCWINTLAMKK